MASRFTRPKVSVRLGKHQHVGGRQVRGEILAEAKARVPRLGVLRLQARALRAVADHDLRALPRHLEEGVDVLLDRDASDVGGDGTRQLEKVLAARAEQLGVDAALPVHQVAEAACAQHAAHGLRAHHAGVRRAVEPAQPRVGEPQRDRPARAQVLRELRVVGGGEAQAAPHTVAPRGQAERPLRGDVHCLGLELLEVVRKAAHRPQRHADLRVAGTGEGAKIARLGEPDLVPEASQPGGGLRQSVHDAVGLGKPGVGHDHDPHAAMHPYLQIVTTDVTGEQNQVT